MSEEEIRKKLQEKVRKKHLTTEFDEDEEIILEDGTTLTSGYAEDK